MSKIQYYIVVKSFLIKNGLKLNTTLYKELDFYNYKKIRSI